MGIRVIQKNWIQIIWALQIATRIDSEKTLPKVVPDNWGLVLRDVLKILDDKTNNLDRTLVAF